MLHPSMTELLEKVDNRYLLVNVAAKRARQIAEEAEINEVKLSEKPVKLALDDIVSGKIVNTTNVQANDVPVVTIEELYLSNGQTLVARVAVAAAVYSIARPYDYSVPAAWRETFREGHRVMVPFGAGNR